MKNLFFSIIFLVFATPIFAQTGTIVVKVSGIENNKGVVQIGLYNSEESFPVYEKTFKGAAVKADKSGVSHTFTNIPAGKYAVAVWHDEDEDKTKNTNLFGAPKENYGFSLNIYGSFGPPKFEKVSFKVDSGKKKNIKINIE
jgi:uncharacterized protein (DUF2141 family)